MEVSRELALFFFDQVAGQYSGHMSAIPNNPTLRGLCEAHAATGRVDFAEFLAAIASALKDERKQ